MSFPGVVPAVAKRASSEDLQIRLNEFHGLQNRRVQDELVGRLVQLDGRIDGIQEFAGKLFVIVERDIDRDRNSQTAN
jgi:hypothetical protein